MTRLRDKFAAGRFCITVEYNPPKSADIASALPKLARFAGRVDAVNVTDSPMAKARMSPIAASLIIERETGIETIFNVTCRDRNLIGLHADLLGASALGLSNILCVTGDPPGLGDWKEAKGVYEFNSTGLLSLVSSLNSGVDHGGKTLPAGTDLFPGAVCCPASQTPEAELREAERKARAGARFFLSQPVFESRTARDFLAALRERSDAPVLPGVMPLKTVEFARYLDEKVPGIRIPPGVIDRLAAVPPGRVAPEGIRLAADLARELQTFAPGIHLMPTGPIESIEEILSALGR
ncbi:MAG: methylenetetrahydrofolate reductase [Deltaproteobacteria bacterium]|nr:methylenetetrahydrofolate reductase [Deltaproteobacteria bacterium]